MIHYVSLQWPRNTEEVVNASINASYGDDARDGRLHELRGPSGRCRTTVVEPSFLARLARDRKELDARPWNAGIGNNGSKKAALKTPAKVSWRIQDRDGVGQPNWKMETNSRMGPIHFPPASHDRLGDRLRPV